MAKSKRSFSEYDCFENCVLIAHFDGEGWLLEVVNADGEIIAFLDYYKMFENKKKTGKQLEKCGFKIITH